MEQLKSHMKNVWVEDLQSFGILRFEVPEVELKVVNEDYFNKFQLLCFDKYLVLIRLEDEEIFVKQGFWGPKLRNLRTKRFYKFFPMRNFHEVRLNTNDETQNNLHLSTYDGVKLNSKESLVMKFAKNKKDNPNLAQALNENFEDLRLKCAKKGNSKS